MTKKAPKLTLIQCDDYSWLFIDGKIVHRGGCIDWPHIIQKYELLKMDEFYIDYKDETHPEVSKSIEITGDLPEDLSVFGIKKKYK